jgi:peptidoglycan/LPS O-acetylase OafA/YrhL
MRIEQLTFTRFIAALLIVIFHYGLDIFPFNLNRQMFSGANVGVSYFFVLSGFVMIIAYYKKQRISAFEYLRNRFARIYPLYMLALLLFIGYRLVGTNAPILIDEVLLSSFMIQSWIPGKALLLNFPGWSLSVELFFYISFPILFNLFYRKFGLKQLLIPCILFFVLSQVVFIYGYYSPFYTGFKSVSHDLLFYFPVMHLNEFILGNIAGLYLVNKKDWKAQNNSIYILLSIIACGVLLTFSNAMIFHNGLLSVIFLPLILWIATDNSWIAKISQKRFFVYLGEISYGVYILQIPVFIVTRRILIYLGIQNKTMIFYAALLALLVFSSITYTYIEAPLRKRIKNIKFVAAKS